jgi:hypothetical protein
MAMVRNFEFMLGQTLNHSVYNSVLLCNVIVPFFNFLFAIIKFDIYIYIYILAIGMITV